MSTAAQASEAEGSRPLQHPHHHQHHHQLPDQDGEQQPRPSDYDMFIRQAEEDDQRRTAKAGKQQQQQPPPSHHQLPLNPFYSNNWPSQPDPPGGNSTSKLAEIQESDGEDGFSSASASAGAGTISTSTSTEHTPAAAAADPGSPQHPAPPSGGGGGGGNTTTTGAARDDDDVAAAASASASSSAAARRFSLPRRALTEPCVQQAGVGGVGIGVGGGGGGRHVQFSRNAAEVGEREKERLGGRRGSSGSSCAHRLKSPPRPVRRQRSMMKMIADYIRHPRG